MSRKPFPWAQAILALSTSLFLACGGGGTPVAPVPVFTMAARSVTFNAATTDATPPAQTVLGSIVNATSTVTLTVSFTNTGIADAEVMLVPGSTTGSLIITPRSPSSLGPGTFTDTITITASQGGQPIQGSPQSIAVTYLVTGPGSSLSVEKSSVSFSATLADATPAVELVSWSLQNPRLGVSVYSDFTHNGLADATLGNGIITITPKSPSALGVGTYTDTITISAYTDSTKTTQLEGSPRTIAVTYVVSPAAGSSFSLQKSSLSVTAGDADPVPAVQVVAVTNIVPNVYLFTSSSANGVAGAPFQSTGGTTGEVRIALANPAALGVGVYQDTVSVWACSDAAGTHEIAGTRTSIAVTYNVVSGSIPAQGAELILNGDFSGGLTHWGHYAQNGGAGNAVIENGALKATITALGTQHYPSDVQVNCLSSLYCVQGRKYRLSFDAWADANRSLGTTINENGHDLNGDGFAYSAHAYKNHAITTVKTTCTLDFTMTVTNTDAALLFLAGESLGTIYLDNVSFVEIP